MVGVALIATSFYFRWIVLVTVCVIGGLLIGLWRGSESARVSAPAVRHIGNTVQLSGTVSDDVDKSPDGQFRLRLDTIAIEGVAYDGMAWITVGEAVDVRRSDKVTLRVKVSEGFGSFVITGYRGVIESVKRPQPGDIALTIRDAFGDTVKQSIPEPEASLGLGFLLGQRRALPSDLEDALRTAGLMHVVVASGYNLTILVRAARRLFAKISRFTAFAAASGLVVSFVAVTGLSPSMSRAGLVTGLSLLAWYYGRRIHPFVLLTLAAAITGLIRPSYVWGDIGWQLSFAAFAGVMLLAPLLQVYFFGDKKPGMLRQILGETIAAQLTTLPILVTSFGYLSTVAPVANILVVPLIPLAMLLVFLTGVSGFLLPILGAWLGWLTTKLLDYIVWIVSVFAEMPWASISVALPVWASYGFYVVLIGGGIYLWKRTHYRFLNSSIVD